MPGGQSDEVRIRESEAGGCPACGANLSQRETGWSIDVVTGALVVDPDLLEPLLSRRCTSCGSRYDWDVLVLAVEDQESLDPEAREAEVREALRGMLAAPQPQPRATADRIRRDLGVAGIYVDDHSDVARRLREASAQWADRVDRSG